MVRHCRLPQAKCIGELSDRGSPISRIEQNAQKLEPRRVGDRAKRASEILGCRALERRTRRPVIGSRERRGHLTIIPVDRLASMSEADRMRGVSVLADPTRAAILRMMLTADDGRVLVGRAADTLGLRQPTVSHHMKALLDEGIVTRAPSGRVVWYAIAPDQHDRVATLLRSADDDGHRTIDLLRIVDDLTTRFEGRLDRDAISHTVDETHRLLARTSHPRHLASRTAAFAAQRLEDAATPALGSTPTVLFVCVQNAGRSQIAAAILRHLAGDRGSP